MNVRTLALVSAFALVLPAVASAQRATGRAVPRTQAENSPAFRTGYDRGLRTGEEDGRSNRQFNYENKSDYRSGDAGWNRNYGDREGWRVDFRLGFERGYRDGYGRYRPGAGNYGGYGNSGGYGRDGSYGDWRPGAGGPPPWANGRGRGRGGYQGGGYQYNEIAFRNGFTDGYEEGLKAGRGRDRFDPVREGRYRDGDHGYNRNYYGTRDIYKLRYREAFIEGYEYGYNDGRRYDNRNYNNGRPSWWPW